MISDEITNDDLQKVMEEKVNGVYPHVAITNNEGAIVWVSTGYLAKQLLASRQTIAMLQRKLDAANEELLKRKEQE